MGLPQRWDMENMPSRILRDTCRRGFNGMNDEGYVIAGDLYSPGLKAPAPAEIS